MKKCEECGKTLGIFKGYHHPTMGKTHLLCSNCYNEVNESVQKWQKFILLNSFNNGTSKNTVKLASGNLSFDFSHKKKIFDNVLIESKI